MNIIVKLNYTFRLVLSFVMMFLIGGGSIFTIGYTDINEIFGISLWFIGLIAGAVTPFIIMRTIRCPKCKTRIFWKYFNRIGKNPYPNRLECNACPECGYDPEKEKL